MNLLDQEKLKKINLNYWAYTIISYYLSLQLFKYGFDKLFKHQFYLPEPNTAFTTLSQLSPDILYWTTMGSSYSYSVFCGIIEIIPAVLLLFRRTSSLGGIIAALVMVNVVMINFGFDISVKVYACFLLFISGIVAYPGIRKIIDVFIYKNVKDLQQLKPTFHAKKAFPYIITKMFIISYILVESLAVYFRSGSFNDDKAERPYLHGAYNIIDFVKNNDTIPPLLTNKDRFKRIFIHREGYFITQNMNDEMDDYKMNFDFINKKLILKTYDQNEIIIDYLFSEKDSTLTLKGNIENIRVYIKAKQIDLKRLPLFQKSFHWTLDDYLR